MGINRRSARFAKTHQRQITALGDFNRERGGGGNGEQDLDAAHR